MKGICEVEEGLELGVELEGNGEIEEFFCGSLMV